MEALNFLESCPLTPSKFDISEIDINASSTEEIVNIITMTESSDEVSNCQNTEEPEIKALEDGVSKISLKTK